MPVLRSLPTLRKGLRKGIEVEGVLTSKTVVVNSIGSAHLKNLELMNRSEQEAKTLRYVTKKLWENSTPRKELCDHNAASKHQTTKGSLRAPKSVLKESMKHVSQNCGPKIYHIRNPSSYQSTTRLINRIFGNLGPTKTSNFINSLGIRTA